MDPQIPLTQTVQKGGCAAKVAATELRKILNEVRFPEAHANLLVDGGLFDDGAVYKITDEIALVQTLDFFTPIVDSPKLFGEIAAANALSDVYAMGGLPKTAMAILAFPTATMASSVIVEILQGASDKISEALANFVGGHSIDDDTLKFGLSVTGIVHPQKVWSNKGARAGDKLILTKAIGTGTLTAALKRRAHSESDISEALKSMAMLNNIMTYLGEDQLAAIHAATDITGFALSGHSFQMAKASEKHFIIQTKNIPALPLAKECLEKGFLTKAHRSNAEYTHGKIDVTRLSPQDELFIHDPQTSGGLLLSVDSAQCQSVLDALKVHFTHASVIGDVGSYQNSDERKGFSVSFE